MEGVGCQSKRGIDSFSDSVIVYTSKGETSSLWVEPLQNKNTVGWNTNKTKYQIQSHHHHHQTLFHQILHAFILPSLLQHLLLAILLYPLIPPRVLYFEYWGIRKKQKDNTEHETRDFVGITLFPKDNKKIEEIDFVLILYLLLMPRPLISLATQENKREELESLFFCLKNSVRFEDLHINI